jgi:hypothetical protein
MINRRHFLGGLSALTASYMFTSHWAANGAVFASETTSADGTLVPPAASIVDKLGSIWTLVDGVVYKNGTALPNANGTASDTQADSCKTTELLWYGSLIFRIDTAKRFFVWGNYYAFSTVGEWLPCKDPRIPSVPLPGMFYGINGHYDYPFTAAQVVTMLQALGCSTYRSNCVNDPTQLDYTVGLAEAFQQAGLTLFPVIDAGLHDASGNLWTSEADAYSQGFSNATAVTTALKPYGVTMYECGNELSRDPSIILNSGSAGNLAADFNNTNWPVMRGMMRGLIDGVKSVQQNAKCGINFTVNDVGASDALWDGTQPDGSSGYPKVRWDITTWHNYEVYGDIFDLGTDGAGPGFNLPIYCKARYGVPFMITEWNANPEDTESDRAAYVTQHLGEYYQARKTDAIQATMYYELDSGDDTYGIVDNNGVPINPTYSAFQSFVSANADTK